MKGRLLLVTGAAALVLFGLSVAAQFVEATYGAGVAPPPRVETPSRGLRIVEGVPLAHLSGSHYEIGRQHGRIFRDQVHHLYREYFEALAIPAVGRAEMRRWAKAAEPFVPKNLREEMRGLADTTGLTYEQVVMINCMPDRLQALMCSTVVATGPASVGGEVYFGRNLDFPGRNILHRATIVLAIEPDGGTPMVIVTWPGLIGVLSGMSARGVAGATMMIHQGGGIRTGMPYTLMYREALSAARKTSDVFDYIRQAKRTCPNNFMVVDSTGAAEVVEWAPDTVARRSAEEGSLCSTNHFRSLELEGIGWPMGMRRYKSLDAFLEQERGSIDLAGIKEALREVATPWFLNVQSMIFLPARRAMHLAVGQKLPAAAQRWVYLDRQVLFGDER